MCTLLSITEEDTVSPLGRIVMVIWLFLLMVITSSYTANLTSILTVQQLSSPITGIDSLIASNLPIGYQVGSFAYNYLTETLYIPSSRLVPLGSPAEYERALRQGPDNGGVGAVIDELMYIELFLSRLTDFGIIGQTFTRSGWGFVSTFIYSFKNQNRCVYMHAWFLFFYFFLGKLQMQVLPYWFNLILHLLNF